MTHTGKLTVARSHRRGTALIVVMMLVLFFSGTTLILLGSSQTSMAQSSGNVSKAKATTAMDAGVQWVIQQLVTGQLVTGSASAGFVAWGEGEFSYTVSDPSPNPSNKYRVIDVTGRVASGWDTTTNTQIYTNSRVRVTVELVPTVFSVPGAITIDATTQGGSVGGTVDGNDLWIDFNGTPGTVTGVDINEATILPEPDTVLHPPTSGVAITPFPTELGSDPAATQITVSQQGGGTLAGSPAVTNNSASVDPAFLDQIRLLAASSTNKIVSSGTFDMAGLAGAGFTSGTAANPTLLVVDLADGETGVKLSAVSGYGVLYVKSDNYLPTGNDQLLALNGSTVWRGLVYIEVGEVRVGGLSTNGTILEVSGTAKLLGGAVIGALNEWDYPDDTLPYTIAHFNGGGTGKNVAYSSSGLEYASRALSSYESAIIRSYQVVTGMGL